MGLELSFIYHYDCRTLFGWKWSLRRDRESGRVCTYHRLRFCIWVTGLLRVLNFFYQIVQSLLDCHWGRVCSIVILVGKLTARLLGKGGNGQVSGMS